MPPKSKHWETTNPIPPNVEKDLRGYPAIIRQVLYNRGYPTPESARLFLEAKSPEGTNPNNMLGIPEAVDRIQFAIDHNQPITVYGDYDVDGITATALLVEALNALGADAREYIPNRFDEGYGLNILALNSLKEAGVQLVVTVDCGIRSLKEAEHARELGMDLIISDHHHPGEYLPTATAIINPKQAEDNYPEKNLAGVGIAYKLVSSLFIRNDNKFGDRFSDIDQFLDLVALGTVADLAPLIGENRTLVKEGLIHINNPRRQGILSLIGASGLTPGRITASHIGFGLGPRLNAAGRLDSALDAYNLLITKDVSEAGHLALRLDSQNRKRQQITRDIQHRAEEIALSKGKDAILLFAVDPEFNRGIVGLAASRLQDQFYRPAIVAERGPEYTIGSCRSIPEFHITDALDKCSDILVRYGGHAAAAGFTVHNNNLDELETRLSEITIKQLTGLDLRPTIVADIELPFSELKPEILEYLNWLQPTGYGNPDVLFISRDIRVVRHRNVGKDNTHLKLTVTDGKIYYDAIAFNQGHWVENMPKLIDMMYHFERNEYNGRVTLQLNILDIKPSYSG
jgi:single-stranded-DNA-specific exonuclease